MIMSYDLNFFWILETAIRQSVITNALKRFQENAFSLLLCFIHKNCKESFPETDWRIK